MKSEVNNKLLAKSLDRHNHQRKFESSKVDRIDMKQEIKLAAGTLRNIANHSNPYMLIKAMQYDHKG